VAQEWVVVRSNILVTFGFRRAQMCATLESSLSFERTLVKFSPGQILYVPNPGASKKEQSERGMSVVYLLLLHVFKSCCRNQGGTTFTTRYLSTTERSQEGSSMEGTGHTASNHARGIFGKRLDQEELSIAALCVETSPGNASDISNKPSLI
jgi:hypothetical protein